MSSNIEGLIGYFNLDPTRVLDILLDSFENNFWNSEAYLSLLKKQQFKASSISSVLGFKLSSHLE